MTSLIEGNEKFLQKSELQKQREENLLSQSPKAAILSCADSRVPPEIIFSEGIGELFVVRCAGNVADDVAIASIEFAIDILKTPILIIMGHENCGAVRAALDLTFLGQKIEPISMNTILEKIQPSLGNISKEDVDTEEGFIQAIKDNALYQWETILKKSSLIRGKIREQKLKSYVLYYDMSTGKVHILYQS